MEGQQRILIITADDFGIGPATSDGILDAAEAGRVTGSVLLVNSPYAEESVRCWRQRGCPMELGWHPTLTLDGPVVPAGQVPSLIGPDGMFWPLEEFLRRWLLGRLREEEIELEFRAQLQRFRELTGQTPVAVNSHQHVAVFAPVGHILLGILEKHKCFPFVRRVRETWGTLLRVRGARLKRTLLNCLGRRLARVQADRQFPGNDWLAGITDPKWVLSRGFFRTWLQAVPGQVVELMCHPGHLDATLIGRDCEPDDGMQQRRVVELCLLRQPQFLEAVRSVGFTLAAPSQLTQGRSSNDYAA